MLVWVVVAGCRSGNSSPRGLSLTTKNLLPFSETAQKIMDNDETSTSSAEDSLTEQITRMDVFVYMGEGGGEIPADVVRVRVDPSVIAIPARAFFSRHKLEEVELCDGLLEIGPRAFSRCISLTKIKVPSSVSAIRQYAFASCTILAKVELNEGLRTIERHAFFNCSHLNEFNIPSTVKNIGTLAFLCTESVSLIVPDGIENIGDKAFSCCVFPQFRTPALITTIPTGMLCQCKCMFSLEIPEKLEKIERYALWSCYSLRNLAISHHTFIEEAALRNCADLQNLFESEAKVIDALRHRFEGLPIHRMIYYQSYYPLSLERFHEATIVRSGQYESQYETLDPTGKHQDCLGMTPLHILACGTVHEIGLYRAMIEKYPENLIAKDHWGTLPLLYALWSNAPIDIINLLLERHQSLYPHHQFNWSKMIETLGRASAPLNVIENYLRIQTSHVQGHAIEWDEVLNEVARDNEHTASAKAFRFLMKWSYSERVEAIGIKEWRGEITSDIDNTLFGRRARLTEIRAKLARYEYEYYKMKEATSLLELALWKLKMDAYMNEMGYNDIRRKECPREECRIASEADYVIGHVLPYLLPSTSRITFSLDDSRR